MSSESLLRTKINTKEREKYYEIYKMFDINKKGSFGVKELIERMNFYGMNPNEQEALEMILVIDNDGNGRVSFEEFLDVFIKRLKDTSEAQRELREAFKVFDRQSNGFLSKEEFRKAMTELGDKLNEEEVEEMIREVSSEMSEDINYEEFITIMTSAHK